MTWFWPAMGALAIGLIVLAWMSDVAAKRKGLSADAAAIARNLREAKRERRHRLMLLRRSWVPTDTHEQGKQMRSPWRNP